MKTDSEKQIPDARLAVYREIEFDEAGFQLPEKNSTKIYWNDIVRVASCYEIHPIAIVDWDYWAFQTHDINLLIWVEINEATESKRFSKEVENRFGKTDIPPMKDWIDNDQNICSYVIWPKADIGKKLYELKTKHWWSLKGRLVHAQNT